MGATGNTEQGEMKPMKHLKKILCAGLAALMLLSTGALATGATVNSDSARFYSSDSTSSQSVPLEKGMSVSVKDVSGSWARVSVKGVTGYVPIKYLTSASRYKAYTNKSTHIYRSASSSSDKVAVEANTKLYVVGVSGDFLRVQNASGSRTGYVPASAVSRSKVSTSSGGSSGSWKSKVVKMNWNDGGSSVLSTGHYGYIYDIDTGITIKIKRMGGHNHADVEPATAEDTAKLKKIAGGSFSWDCIPVILKAGGKYVACSINTTPHGDQSITDNGYDGQFCLHMVGSTTHGTETTNESHQAAINKAYNWAH